MVTVFVRPLKLVKAVPLTMMTQAQRSCPTRKDHTTCHQECYHRLSLLLIMALIDDSTQSLYTPTNVVVAVRRKHQVTSHGDMLIQFGVSTTSNEIESERFFQSSVLVVSIDCCIRSKETENHVYVYPR